MGYRSDSYDPDGGLLAAEEADDGSYIGRHWRGNLSLAQTYWLNGFLTNIALAALGGLFLVLEQTGRSLRLIAAGFIVYGLLFLVIRTWTLVGIWRSAGRHAARGGTAGWGTVARVMVVLGILATIAQMPSLGLQAKEYGLIAIGRDPIGPMASITQAENGQVIKLKGIISTGIADEFEQVVSANPKARLVLLDSSGGRIFEALRMAELIRSKGFDTRVEEHCASACTLLLLAGKERSAHRFAEIGFHQPDFPGISEAQRAEFIASNRNDYLHAGISPEFLDRVMDTSPADMWYPTHAELVDAKVLSSEEITVGSSRVDEQKLQKLLARMAAELNASRGVMLDDITRIDGATVVGTELQIHYGLTRSFSSAQAKQLGAGLRANITKEICGSPRKTMIEMGARFNFDYLDPSNFQVADITIDKCQG
jgi:hypothetical protein